MKLGNSSLAKSRRFFGWRKRRVVASLLMFGMFPEGMRRVAPHRPRVAPSSLMSQNWVRNNATSRSIWATLTIDTTFALAWEICYELNKNHRFQSFALTFDTLENRLVGDTDWESQFRHQFLQALCVREVQITNLQKHHQIRIKYFANRDYITQLCYECTGCTHVSSYDVEICIYFTWMSCFDLWTKTMFTYGFCI